MTAARSPVPVAEGPDGPSTEPEPATALVQADDAERARELLAELGVLPDTVLVIRGRDLLTIDEVVTEDDVVELRPVISGGRA